MKKSKELVEHSKAHGMIKIKEIMVASASMPGDYHNVIVYEDKTISCDCVGSGLYNMDCRHIKRVRQMITKEGV